VFREAVKGSSSSALTTAAQHGEGSLEPGKSTSLSLRVSDSEQARIQSSAAMAKLSVSAYLRQCALDMDDLRGQVGLALARLREQQVRAAPPPSAEPGLAAIPGILARFARQSLRRWLGGGNYRAVSIR